MQCLRGWMVVVCDLQGGEGGGGVRADLLIQATEPVMQSSLLAGEVLLGGRQGLALRIPSRNLPPQVLHPPRDLLLPPHLLLQLLQLLRHLPKVPLNLQDHGSGALRHVLALARHSSTWS